jgi:predicted Zn-ribbon and HTH transcriptional regulator
MAQGIRLVCEHCSKAIEAWDDGNPYYLDRRGRKKYAYHPDPKRERCTGNDSPHLCLDCGEEFLADSNAPDEHCVKCKSTNIMDTFSLAGHRCPVCKLGVFAQDPGFVCIS